MQNTNSLRDEIRLQHDKLKDQPFSQKLDYFWDYYKVHCIIVFLSACLFGSILHGILSQKETVLSIALINAFPNVEDEILMADFENWLGLNTSKQQVLLDSSYYINDDSTSPYADTYEQKFSTNAMAGQLDVVLADRDKFDFYGNQGFFRDLTALLSQEEFQQHQDDFYYVDLPNDNSDEKVPVGIKISDVDRICQTSCYPNTDAYFGIVSGTGRTEAALLYLGYLKNHERHTLPDDSGSQAAPN